MQQKEVIFRWQIINPLIWLVWVCITPFVVMLIRKKPLKWGNIKGALLRIFTMIVAISTIHILILLLILNAYWILDTGEAFPTKAQYWFLCPQTFTTNFLVLIVIIGITMAIDNYFINQDLQLKSSKLETQLAQAKIAALRRQLQPHFLFNTLNALNTLILRKDHKKAELMLGKISTLLRETIEAKDDKWIQLEEELRITRLYLEIHEVRFGDRLEVSYTIDPDALKYDVPNFLLQPLVENALSHGIGKIADKGKIEMRIDHIENCLSIQVADNGPGMPDAGLVEGIGLGNTRERLQQMYPQGFEMTYERSSIGGFQVSIKMPCKYDDCKKA